MGRGSQLPYYIGARFIAVLKPDSKHVSPHKNTCPACWPSINKRADVHQHLASFAITHHQSFLASVREEMVREQAIYRAPGRCV